MLFGQEMIREKCPLRKLMVWAMAGMKAYWKILLPGKSVSNRTPSSYL
jgi:hypothetical protein